MRHKDSMKALYLAHSVVEILFTLFLIVIHMLNARAAFSKVCDAIRRLENFDPRNEQQLRPLKTCMWMFMAAGLVHVAASVACFVVFHTHAHLGWTLLSNQFCIISINALFALYASLMTTAIGRITEDQQKVRKQCIFSAYQIARYTIILTDKRCYNGIEDDAEDGA